MQKISSDKLRQILNVSDQIVDVEIDDVSTDSRNINANSLFIALRGEKFDAHNFVPDVYKKGCKLVVVDHQINDIPLQNQLIVKDTLIAFGQIGAYNRSLFKGKVIGLTGSAGKTTTKEEIAFLLSKFGKTYATAGNHNNYVGVPRCLCDLDMSADYAVIEMGMSAKGEISHLTNLVKPDIAVVTNVYPMHIEFFENFAGIAHAKAEIFEGLPQKSGKAIINEDTNFADILVAEAQSRQAEIITFGKNKHPSDNFTVQESGEHHLYNAWCALSVIQALGLDVEKAASYIKDFGALEGRGKKHKLKCRKGIYTLIDDSYSGQPEAMLFAISALNEMKTNGRKIAVLGKMAELGKTSKERHIEIGDHLKKTDIDIVVGVCPEMKDMLARLGEDKIQYYFDNKENVADFLYNELLQNNDTVLIKGARYSSKLYQVTEELIKKGALQS
ncbi:MAG: UDP-N-acetylmuramoyl-tripeptide--D-alanyl-D-alanine ligase [Alphaproteobacteria bacterium]|nr:UDP-N-acetylmuramoyl-tripeptide--D-alanyl-D-alanine ligase [Alphaproteobacteria bacterium]